MMCVHLPVANSSNVSRWGEVARSRGTQRPPALQASLQNLSTPSIIIVTSLAFNPLILWDLTFKINMSVNATNVGLTRIKDSDKESEPRTKIRIKDQNRNQEALRSYHILKWNPIWYGCIFLLITLNYFLLTKMTTFPVLVLLPPESLQPYFASNPLCL